MNITLSAEIIPSWWSGVTFAERRERALAAVRAIIPPTPSGREVQIGADGHIEVACYGDAVEGVAAFAGFVARAELAAETVEATEGEMLAAITRENADLVRRMGCATREVEQLRGGSEPDRLYGVYVEAFARAASSGVVVVGDFSTLRQRVAAALGAEHANGGQRWTSTDPMDARPEVDYRPRMEGRASVLKQIDELLAEGELGAVRVYLDGREIHANDKSPVTSSASVPPLAVEVRSEGEFPSAPPSQDVLAAAIGFLFRGQPFPCKQCDGEAGVEAQSSPATRKILVIASCFHGATSGAGEVEEYRIPYVVAERSMLLSSVSPSAALQLLKEIGVEAVFAEPGPTRTIALEGGVTVEVKRGPFTA